MRRLKVLLALWAAASIAGLPAASHAAPKIPRARIPENTPYAVRRHIEALYSSNAVARGWAAVHLGRMGDQAAPAVPFLMAMLGDDARLTWEESTSENPLETLKQRRVGLHKERETSPGREAARALAKIVKGLVEAGAAGGGPEGEALGKIGASALEDLIAALKHTDAHFRRNAALVLGGTKNRRAAQPLIALLTDKDPLVRAEAARALGRIRDPVATEALSAALSDEDWHVRRDAAWALGMIRDPRAIEPLLERLGDIVHVQAEAEQALDEIRDRRAVQPLIAKLRDRNKAVRRIATRLLGRIRDRRAVQPLIAALDDRTADVQYEAVKALQAMSGETYGREPKKWQRWWELEKAAQAMADITSGRALQPLFAALKDPNWAVRAVAARTLAQISDRRAVGPLVGALWDKDPGVKTCAARALGGIGDPQAVNGLIAALRDVDAEVRSEAEVALRTITGMNLGPDNKKWQAWWEKNRERLLERYAASVRRKIDALIEALSDADARRRAEATLALQTITGMKLGEDTRSWEDWWEENKERFLGRYAGPAAAKHDEPREETRQTARREEKGNGLDFVLILALVAVLPVALLVLLRVVRGR